MLTVRSSGKSGSPNTAKEIRAGTKGQILYSEHNLFCF